MSRPLSLAVVVVLSFTLSQTERVHGQILVDGVPNIDDPRLHAWYDGDEAIGADGIPETPVWPNKQGDPNRSISNGFAPGEFILEPVETENGHSALRYEGVVTWQDEAEWGVVDNGFTVFVTANVRDVDSAYFFTGNQGGGGAEVNAGFGGVDAGVWSLKGNDGTRIQTADVLENVLIGHTFTFFEEGIATHHRLGELVGGNEIGTASLAGFVLGGRQNGAERASVDLAEVLVYNEALMDDDRMAVEGYLFDKFFGELVTRCDLNNDNVCNVFDADILMNGIAADDAAMDLNEDGVVNDGDRDWWLAEAGAENGLDGPYLVGDSNLDLIVDAGDLNNLALVWQTDNDNWSDGNFTGSGVGAPDLNELALNWQESGPAVVAAASQAVPEPTSGMFVVVGLASLWIATRRW